MKTTTVSSEAIAEGVTDYFRHLDARRGWPLSMDDGFKAAVAQGVADYLQAQSGNSPMVANAVATGVERFLENNKGEVLQVVGVVVASALASAFGEDNPQ